jgi:hypothetical protein
MPRLEAHPDWRALRIRDLETGHAHAVHVAGHACVHAARHRRHPVAGQVERVGDGISNDLA